LDGILAAAQGAQAPKQFTLKFLESLGFASSTDRLVIGVLKALGFLNDSGVPAKRYFEWLDGSQAKSVMADAIRQAYADLFQVNKNANDLSLADLKGKIKTLTEGRYSDGVIGNMAATFKALSKHADFKAREEAARRGETEPSTAPEPALALERGVEGRLGSLVYSVNLVLPDSRDPAVYEALFRSLKEHLLN